MTPARRVGTSFALLALFLMAGLPLAGGQPQPGRLVVTATWLDATPFHANGLHVGTTVHVTVRNDGQAATSGYSIQYEWEPAGEARRPMNADAAASQDIDTDGLLAGGDSRTHHADWNLQPDQLGPGRLIVTVRNGIWNTTGALALMIASHALTLSIAEPAQAIAAEETRFVRLRLENTGNVAESVTLDVPDAESGNRSRLQTQILPQALSVPPNTMAVADLFITYPFRGDASGFVANFSVRATWAQGVLAASTPALVARECCPTPAGPWSAYRLGSREVTVPPAQEREVWFSVSNDRPVGNISDRETFRMSAVVDGPWSVTTSPAWLALAGGESGAFKVLVAAPADAASGRAATLQAKLEADHARGTPQAFSVPLRAEGAAPTVVSVASTTPRLYAGDPVTVVVRVANLGDRAASAASHLRVSSLMPGDFTRATYSEVSPLAVGEEDMIQIRLPGPPPSSGVAHVTASWSPAIDQPAQSVMEGTFEVRLAAVEVVPPPPASGVPGERVSYQALPRAFSIYNAGTHTETIRLIVTAASGDGSLGDAQELSLVAGQRRTVPVLHELPRPSGLLTEDELTLRVEVVGRPALSWEATVATRIEDRLAPSITTGVMPAQWGLLAPLRVGANAKDDGAVVDVHANVTRPDGSWSLVALAADGPGSWGGVLVFGQAGNHTIRFEALDAVGNLAQAAPHTVDAVRAPPPVLLLFDPPTGPVPSDARLRFNVSDERPIATVKAWRAGDPGNATTLLLVAGVAELPLGSLPGLVAGAQSIIVEAANDAGSMSNITVELLVLTLAIPPVTAGAQETDNPAAQASPLGAVALVALAAAVLRYRRRL